MEYQWFPGHMTKAIRQMEEDIKLIDLIIEIVDARIPLSSRNPVIDKLANGKGRIILLNKSDLADPQYNNEWISFYEKKNIQVVLGDSRKNSGLGNLKNAILNACNAKIERDKKRGIMNRPLRAMVCGIPNVGKSTFINSYAGKACAKTGDKPGVTKGKQWIRLNKKLELLDTPGVLWPKFEDKIVGRNLAMIGSINGDILDMNELALEIIGFMKSNYPGRLTERYTVDENTDNIAFIEGVARVRGCLVKGGDVDMDKAAYIIVNEFRNMKLGRISIERPEGVDK